LGVFWDFHFEEFITWSYKTWIVFEVKITMFVTKLKGTDVNPQSPPLGAGEFGNDLFLYMDKTNLIFLMFFFPNTVLMQILFMLQKH
jgi:hypothetical protein